MPRSSGNGSGPAGGLDPTAEPHNLEAERAVLGAALLRTPAADYLADHLTADAFYRQAHQVLFDAMRTLRSKDVEVDLVTLKQHLGPQTVDDLGGPSYIAGLTDGLPTGLNVSHYAAILLDLRTRRAVGAYGRALADAASGGEGSGRELLLDADRRLLALQAGHSNGRQASLADTVPMLLEDLEYRTQHRGQLLGLDTGYAGVNDLTFGWQAGDLVVLGARPSIGKTSFVLNTAMATARAGGRVAIFSLEMRRKQLEFRLLSSASRVPLTNLLTGMVNDGDWPALQRACGEFQGWQMEIDDSGGRTVHEIRSACRRMKAEGELDLVVVDYAQLIPGSLDRKGATRNEELTDVSRRLKCLADEGGFPVLLLSQLVRPDGKAAEQRPSLRDLRDSGAFEQDADVVCFLHRKDHRAGGRTEFIVGKARNGPTGTVLLSFDRETTTFLDGAEPEPEPPPEMVEAERKAKTVSFFKQRARKAR